MSWGIAETASDFEKLRAESADYLGGLNSCGLIDYDTYSQAFDFYMDLLQKMYDLGKKEECEKYKWISCSERLPDKEGDYLVTDDAGGVKTIDVDTLLHYEDSGEPFWCYSQNPIAWRELPVPFGEE